MIPLKGHHVVDMTNILRIQVPIPYPVKWVNCYYFPGSVPTLIDTGVNTDEALKTISSAIEAQGGKLSDLRRVIATHGHMDHVGLAGTLAEISGADVFVHQWDTVQWAVGPGQEYIEKRQDFRAFFVEAGVPTEMIDSLIDLVVTRYKRMCSPLAAETKLEDGAVFEFDDFDLRVIHTPGHSPGSVCLFNQQDRSLYTGDTLLPELISNPSVERAGTIEHKALVSHQESLERINSLGVITVYPGHGTPFKDLEARVQKIQDSHGKRSKQVLRILQQSASPSKKLPGISQFIAATKLLGEISELEVFFGVSAAKSHLDALVEQGLASRRKEGSEYVYRPNGSLSK
jgi:glyoxylase-like metal-dependent hydrolase (beta-lactamase superfamily II)